nr:hypothetical protein [uncultured Acidocella sp.]
MNQSQTFSCGLCQSQVQLGAHVCIGCQGTVIYGPTTQELNTFPLPPAILVFFVVQYFIGIDGWHGFIALALAVIAYFIGRHLVHRWRKGMIRTFRRM